ncbi:PREDICTED: uncharacterized protein LOC105121080 isoform X2 [Populus euphratica]|uniref:Uncharacterized protein LOC105121080 isoform X2 n=1 Tax=Populus euphratica TaxID=75702 RepID=A0AAJ6XGJ7_POPEU|nr:PREDICTED: uncharacterized protein LOC105121080 isoform X2 [Populus euphratica]
MAGVLIDRFLRPPPSKQQRIIITALHPHLIYQLQSSRKSVSNSTMRNSVKSREGNLMGAKMSNKVSFPSGFKNKVIKEAMNNLNPSLHDYLSNRPQVQPMRNKASGSKGKISHQSMDGRNSTVKNKVCSSSTSTGSSHTENCFTRAQTSCRNSVQSKTYPMPTEGSSDDLVGAEMSCHNSSGHAYIQSIKDYPIPTEGSSDAETDLIGAKTSCHNFSTHGDIQSIKVYPMPTEGSSDAETDLTGATMSCHNSSIHADVQSTKTASSLIGAEMSCHNCSRQK